jgi:hypothetical protein
MCLQNEFKSQNKRQNKDKYTEYVESKHMNDESTHPQEVHLVNRSGKISRAGKNEIKNQNQTKFQSKTKTKIQNRIRKDCHHTSHLTG